MTKKQLKKLVLESYTGNNLNEKTVEKIAGFLNRKELKQYIKALKLKENKMSVTISLPHNATTGEKSLVKNLFPAKKLIFKVDPSLILGFEVIDNDFMYNINLRNTLENLVTYVSSYD